MQKAGLLTPLRLRRADEDRSRKNLRPIHASLTTQHRQNANISQNGCLEPLAPLSARRPDNGLTNGAPWAHRFGNAPGGICMLHGPSGS